MADTHNAAKQLHQRMVQEAEGTIFTPDQLMSYTGVDTLGEMMVIAQVLLDQKLVILIRQGSELRFQAVATQEAIKQANMTPDEALVYSYITASGREGIWTKTIKARTNMHQHVVLRCLKSLESQRYIKSVKSVKFPTRKIYMLYNLTPSIEVTGGPWFTDGELDSEFVESLLAIIWRFVASKTFPNVFSNDLDLKNMALYNPGYKNYTTVEEILAFIIKSEVTTEELIENDIRSLCQVLVYDDKMEKVELDCYRATFQSVVDMKEESIDESFSIFDASSYLAAANEGDENLIYFDEYQV
ncbi:CYFA0S13e00166g1_1 [Cyberlindnera fabianii]|uniref:DNA-directed RNA polymerase III subunit RPC6 n=1 Tax=Cyberlindnera fabianii TaxID=36022 RepID=A0A061BAD2_CYBFA|nr:CYFA0S13e00166g1_1 [Cyberlindnera fabianii]